MNIQKNRIFLLLFIFFPFLYSAQTEVEMKAQADKLFDSEQYLSATPLYLRLLSLQPREVAYNYKYGTCLLYNSNNKQEAIKYLSFAVNDPAISPDAYYFLGRALHLNYQFNEAIKQYTKYLEKSPNGNKVKDAEREIQMCQNGKRLMTTITDIIVSEKKEITTDKFFRVYDLQDIGGDLLVTADFQTKLDKKNNHIPLVHFPQNASLIYYSSYGDNGNTGKDIYVRRKLPDGTWGMPQQIQGNVNTAFDEDFPYMHPDGNYLYFSSKGHNSMGGYDVFRSKFDVDNNSFGPPENMDFAVSSPDDDLFYVVDSLNKNAYFASARQSELGKLFVYKVNVDRVPLQLAVVKGNFLSEIDPKIKKINFEIRDYANGEVIGKFNSNDKAVYLITFPKGGKYEYNMKIEGSIQEFKFIVSIPFMKEFKPLKQKIIHTMEEGREVVKIVNLFDEEVDDPAAVLAEVIKMRSNLNVNVEEFDMNEVEKDKINKEILDDLGLGDLLLVEVSDVLNKQLKRGAENNNLINNIGNNINNLVVENSVEFIALEEQIKNKVAEANKTQNQENKYILLKEAESLILKQAELKKYSKDLLHLNDSIKEVLSKSTSGADQQKLLSVSQQFDQLYKSGNEKEAVQLIVENKTFLQDILKDNSTELIQNLVDKVVKYDEEISSLKGKVDGYNKDVKTLEIEIQSLQNAIGAAKKKDVPALEQKIAEKQEEIKLIKEELGNLQRIIDRKSQEKFLVNKQIQILQDAISNKSIAVVTKEKAAKALAETEKTNSNTLTAYVSQQIVALEKEDPTLKERIVVASGLKATNIIEEYKTSSKGIQDDPSLSKEDKMYKQLLNDRNTYKILDKRLAEIEKSLIDNKFDENLNKEKQEIINYQKELEVLISNREKQVEALLSQNGTGDRDELIQTIQPGYEAERKSIEANVNLNETEKLQELNNEDEKLVAAIDKELKVVSTELGKNPSDKTLQNKKQALIQIKQNTNAIITQRNTEIDAATNTNETPNIERIVAQIDPTITSRKEQISANNSLSEKEKLQALNKEDEKFLVAVDKELKTVSAQLAKNPADKTLQEKQQALTEVKATTQESISERNTELIAKTNTNETPNVKEIVAQIDPTITSRKEQISANNSLSEKEKLQALNKEDEKFLVAVDKELKTVSEQLAKNPADKTLQGKQQALSEIKATTQESISERNTELIATTNTNETPNVKEIVAQLDPTYDDKIEEVKADNDLTNEEQLKAINEIDKTLIEKIDEELNQVNEKLDAEPSNEVLINNRTALVELKATKENDIKDREEQISSASTSESSSEVTNALIEKIQPGFAKEVSTINNNTELSSDEKMSQLQLKDQKLMTAIDAKLVALEKQLVKQPNNESLQEEKKKLLELKSLIESRMEERVQLMESKSNVELTAESLAEQKNILRNKIDPSYISKRESIAKSNDSDLKKKNAELKLEQQLLEKIQAETTIAQKVVDKDPFNVAAKSKLTVLAELKKETQNNINSINGDVVALKNGQPINSVTEQEKQATINDLSEEYVANVTEIENSTEISEKEKAQQLIDEEKALLNAVEEKKQDVEGQLVKDPGNQTLLKEQAVLAQIEKDIQEKVAQNEAVVNSIEPAVFVSKQEKEEIINRLNETYFSDVKAIEQSNQTALEKLEQIQLLDQKLLGKVYDQLENIENQLMEDPSSIELKKEQEILNTLSEELDKKIENRQIEIAQKTVNSTITNEVKEAAINKIDPSYFKNIEAINQLDSNESEKNQKLLNEEISLLSKVNNELFAIEEALMNNPDDQVKIEERKKLEAIRSDLQASIEQLNEQKNQLSSETTVTAQQKIAKIEEIDASYISQKESIEGNNNLSIKEKAQQLLRLENDFLDKATTEKIKIQEQLNQLPNNNLLKQELAVLEAILFETEKSISAHKNVLNNTNDSVDNKIDKEQIVDDILPDYTSRKEELANSKMVENIKIVEQIKLENELLTKLQLEEKSLNKLLDKNPTDEKNQQKLAAVKDLIVSQQVAISELTARNEELNAQIKATEIISKADVNYGTDIEKLKASTSDTKNSDLAEREVIHQERIATQIAANEKILAKKNNPEILAANEVLKKEVILSKENEQNYRAGNEDLVENNVNQTAFVNNLREDLLQGNSAAMTEEFKTIEELKQQDAVLANYEKALSTQISEKSAELEIDSENEALKEEVSWMKEELTNVQERRRQWKISIGELEKIANEDPTNEGNEFNDPLLTELTQKENKLQSDLTNPELTQKEKQVIQKEINQVQKEQTTQENKLITTEIANKEKVIEAQTKELKAGSTLNTETKLTSGTAIAQQESLSKEVQSIVKEAQETKSVEEKNYLLNTALEKEKQANAIIKEAIIENKIQQLEEENNITSLETQVTLEEKKRRFSIQVGELTRIIKELDTEISSAKGKELLALKEQRADKVQQRTLVQQQLEAIDTRLAQYEKTASTTDPEAMKNTVSYVEEQEIAASEEYKNYEDKARPALEVEKQIANLDAQLNEVKSITKELIKNSIDNPSEENQANLQLNIEKIKQMEADKQTLLSELKVKQQIAKEALPANTEEAMKMQNLVERGILPIKRLAVIAALVPLPANGLEIKAEGTNTYSAAKPIPVDVKNPTGLVYRVQVGAFAKPIPQDLFKEFNPVSGEKLNNGVTRYMAGYFNNSKKVIEVRDQIKGLGYADAFAVAYCDGKRISLAEARILEANGECVAKGENELILEMAANTAITMGLEDTLKKVKVDELSYNKAPGAVNAEPIEKHLGLFFTVQIGVYNKPVNANTVNNISPLMTVRLPNGQIRYSTGMFTSIDNARPKKLEVIDKGVKDAFITAYYKAERITLAEAQKLLDGNGDAILEQNIVLPVVFEPVNPIKVIIPDEPVIENKIERVQIVTKKTFDEFPREVLNRYNSHGSFYYDETDKRVKSAIANSKDELPQVYNFKDDVDTLYIMEALDESSTIISVKFESKSLQGDFIDWLLRYNYRREFIQSEEVIELRIYRIPDVKMEELQLKLELFGLTWSKVTETEQELELEEK